MNEEITIEDSVERLLALEVAHRRIIVIDDASDDRTPEILAALDHPDLTVLRRDLPNARLGKGQGLNAAYQRISALLPGADRERVIVVVVDADGRISPNALPFVAAHFEDPEIGGVQALVRIYNRGGFLTNMQDLEFAIYGSVYQAGKNREGTAGMGGNGQFNRLERARQHRRGGRALAGPADRGSGYRACGCSRPAGDPTRRCAQRCTSRGCRGCGRYCDSARAGRRATCSRSTCSPRRCVPRSRGARLEEALYLFMPLWQTAVGLGFVTAVALCATGQVGVVPSAESIPVVYLLGFANGVLGCFAARHGTGWRSWLWAITVAHLYALYTWILFPVIARALARQLSTRRDWARTDREPLSGTAGSGHAR